MECLSLYKTDYGSQLFANFKGHNLGYLLFLKKTGLPDPSNRFAQDKLRLNNLCEDGDSQTKLRRSEDWRP